MKGLRTLSQIKHVGIPFSKDFSLLKLTTLHTTNTSNNNSNSKNEVNVYKQLENLDFMTATEILFTEPTKKKKFGLDFHLVQFFFACMPSLAVYLVAQYARYDMRKMDAELERKKKESEEKEKEMESVFAEERVAPELLKVKERLDILEENIKEIRDETKKIFRGDISTKQDVNKAANDVSSDSKSKSVESDTKDSEHTKINGSNSKVGEVTTDMKRNVPHGSGSQTSLPIERDKNGV